MSLCQLARRFIVIDSNILQSYTLLSTLVTTNVRDLTPYAENNHLTDDHLKLQILLEENKVVLKILRSFHNLGFALTI